MADGLKAQFERGDLVMSIEDVPETPITKGRTMGVYDLLRDEDGKTVIVIKCAGVSYFAPASAFVIVGKGLG